MLLIILAGTVLAPRLGLFAVLMRKPCGGKNKRDQEGRADTGDQVLHFPKPKRLRDTQRANTGPRELLEINENRFVLRNRLELAPLRENAQPLIVADSHPAHAEHVVRVARKHLYRVKPICIFHTTVPENGHKITSLLVSSRLLQQPGLL